ncbi:MAG: hypothetical protein HC820_07195 [Hydrococcus sp. RM1_1_31]|nr:hypothetical protein [Hydrococcus sp. RM1_1_31]
MRITANGSNVTPKDKISANKSDLAGKFLGKRGDRIINYQFQLSVRRLPELLYTWRESFDFSPYLSP